MGHGLEGGLPARKRQSNLVRGKLSHQNDKQGFLNSPSKIRLSESKEGSPFLMKVWCSVRHSKGNAWLFKLVW